MHAQYRARPGAKLAGARGIPRRRARLLHRAHSVPVAIGGLFCTLLLWSLPLFKRGWVLVLYGVVCIAAALVAAWLSLSAHDPTSLLFVVIGESILLVPVLLPAVLQYSRSRKRRAGALAPSPAESR